MCSESSADKYTVCYGENDGWRKNADGGLKVP